jgi:hypothetical protein
MFVTDVLLDDFKFWATLLLREFHSFLYTKLLLNCANNKVTIGYIINTLTIKKIIDHD